MIKIYQRLFQVELYGMLFYLLLTPEGYHHLTLNADMNPRRFWLNLRGWILNFYLNLIGFGVWCFLDMWPMLARDNRSYNTPGSHCCERQWLKAKVYLATQWTMVQKWLCTTIAEVCLNMRVIVEKETEIVRMDGASRRALLPGGGKKSNFYLIFHAAMMWLST